MRLANRGFTLIELMIVIAIIGILAAVASPKYGQYTKRAKFGEVVQATAPYKTAVSLCAQDFNANPIANCAAGTNGIPEAVSSPTGYIQSLAVSADGVITAEGSDEVDQATYILSPAYSPSTSTLSWSVSGTCDGTSPGKPLIYCKPLSN